MTKFWKVTLTFMICGGTIAAFFSIMIFLLAYTGWFVCCIGLLVGFLQAEIRMIWSTEIEEKKNYKRSSRRGRRGH